MKKSIQLAILVLLTVLILVFSMTAYAQISKPYMQLERIKMPDGFKIELYTDGVRGARSMTLSPKGTLFVGSYGERLYAVVDRNKDHKVDEVIVLAEGLNQPNGVEFIDGDLYVAERNRIIRYDDIESNLYDTPEPVVLNDSFPSDRSHGKKYLRLGPDDKLYFDNGAPCNICEPEELFGKILRMNKDGSDLEVYADGIRHSVGLDWDPQTDELWFTDNGRDELGDEIPPEELNHAPRQGLHFGFPYYFGIDIKDPVFGHKRNISEFQPTKVEMPAHAAAIGMQFYTGSMFPEKYRNGIFIAEHGSWDRSPGVRFNGYRVSFVSINNSEVEYYEPFAGGWLLDDGRKRFGRPVDVCTMADGSLLVSDDFASVIYRITYNR